MSKHEFEFTTAEFDAIRQLLKDQTGIALSDQKRQLVYGRLTRRLRALRIADFKSYLSLLDRDQDELREAVNALTTNVTAFFRENHHFEFLAHTLLPWLYAERPRGKRIRIWSAGCSTGQEPYSIAMVLHEQPPPDRDWDIKILATDLDTSVVTQGLEAVYQDDHVAGISDERLKRHFRKGVGQHSGQLQAAQHLRQLITFKPLNLMHTWPFAGPFDVIFCRNVVIYFDRETRNKLARRYHDLLGEGGVLIIGHSESLADLGDVLEAAGTTIYRRSVDTPRGRAA